MNRTQTLSALLAAILGLSPLGCAQSPTGPKGDPWRFLPGTVVSFSFPAFRDGRQCWVYLPPSYAQSDRRYPVLYLNDGETAFDDEYGMHVSRICEDLIRRGEIEPIIVVAIESGGQRILDYTPWPVAAYSYFGPNGGGDFYIRAIRDTLKPEVDRRFRTLPDPGNTAISGSSVGGLISVYAAYAYDSTFGKVGAFSPSYWWTGFHSFVESSGRPALLKRFYQDTGYPADNWIGQMEEIVLSQGFVLGLNFMSVSAEGGEHSNASWEHRFPEMLRFIFPP